MEQMHRHITELVSKPSANTFPRSAEQPKTSQNHLEMESLSANVSRCGSIYSYNHETLHDYTLHYTTLTTP